MRRNPAKARKPKVLLLGASGKLGRMVHEIWRSDPSLSLDVTSVTRRECTLDGDYVIWTPAHGQAALPSADCIVALWGVTGADADGLSANRDLGLQAVEIGRATGANRVIHCSSIAVYAPQDSPATEDSPCHPPNAYGLSKLEMERTVLDAAQENDPQSVFLRIGNVAGADSLFGNLARGADMVLDQFEDGAGPQRSYISPHDFADLLAVLCLAEKVPGLMNVAAPEPTSMEDIITGCGQSFAFRPAASGARQNALLDTRLMQGLLKLGPHAAKADHLIASARATGVWK